MPNAGGDPNNQNPAGQQQQQNQQPPANNPGNQQQQQQQGQQNQQQGNQQQQQNQFILSQEQFNQRWGEKLTSLEAELGMPLKDIKTFIEKNKPKPAASGEQLSGVELRMAKMEGLLAAGIQGKQVPQVLQFFNIPGKTREEIDQSIKAMIDAKLLVLEQPAGQNNQQQQNNQQGNQQQQQQQNQNVNAAQGAGNPGVQNSQQQQKKIWTEKEVRELRLSGGLTDQIMGEIRQATKEGRVQ